MATRIPNVHLYLLLSCCLVLTVWDGNDFLEVSSPNSYVMNLVKSILAESHRNGRLPDSAIPKQNDLCLHSSPLPLPAWLPTLSLVHTRLLGVGFDLDLWLLGLLFLFASAAASLRLLGFLLL